MNLSTSLPLPVIAGITVSKSLFNGCMTWLASRLEISVVIAEKIDRINRLPLPEAERLDTFGLPFVRRQCRHRPRLWVYLFHFEARMTLHISIRRKLGSLNARTSSLKVPKVLSGRCFMP